MLDRVRVTVWLHRLICHEGYDRLAVVHRPNLPDVISSELRPEPYLWPVFFAIDGRDVQIRPVDDEEGTSGDLVLGGTPSIRLAGDRPLSEPDAEIFGGPDNMGFHGKVLRSGQEARVPSETGLFVRESPALRLPTQCEPLRPQGVLGTVGLIVGLLEHDDLPHGAIRAAYGNFARGLRSELIDVIDGTPIIDAGNLSQEELDRISERIAHNVKGTIMASLKNGDLLAFALGLKDRDDEIGSAVFTIDLPTLVEQVAKVEVQTIRKPITGLLNGVETILGEQHWDLEAIAIATRIRPDDAVMDVVGMHGLTVANESRPPRALWLGPWGTLMGELHGQLLSLLVLHEEFALPAAAAVEDARRIGGSPDTVVTTEMAERVMVLLAAIGERGDRRTRLVAGRAQRVASSLVGHPASATIRNRQPREKRGKGAALLPVGGNE